MLKDNGITPYFVFDGGPLPMKSGTELLRRSRREAKRQKALEYLRSGKRKAANELFQQCVDITPFIAYQLMKALKEHGVEFVVAPYEADAQLAFLERQGVIQGIITEDSDLLVFGCSKVIFKLDKDGYGMCIRKENLTQATEVNLHGFTETQFRQMCILSGCDYLPSIPGMGLKKAYKYLKKWKTVPKVIQQAQFDKMKVPVNYQSQFTKAEWTFLHQKVYDPVRKVLTTVTPVPEELAKDSDALAFTGNVIDDAIARGIGQGRLNPFDYQPYTEGTVDPDCPSPTEIADFLAGKIKILSSYAKHLEAIAEAEAKEKEEEEAKEREKEDEEAQRDENAEPEDTKDKDSVPKLIRPILNTFRKTMSFARTNSFQSDANNEQPQLNQTSITMNTSTKKTVQIAAMRQTVQTAPTSRFFFGGSRMKTLTVVDAGVESKRVKQEEDVEDEQENQEVEIIEREEEEEEEEEDEDADSNIAAVSRPSTRILGVQMPVVFDDAEDGIALDAVESLMEKKNVVEVEEVDCGSTVAMVNDNEETGQTNWGSGVSSLTSPDGRGQDEKKPKMKPKSKLSTIQSSLREKFGFGVGMKDQKKRGRNEFENDDVEKENDNQVRGYMTRGSKSNTTSTISELTTPGGTNSIHKESTEPETKPSSSTSFGAHFLKGISQTFATGIPSYTFSNRGDSSASGKALRTSTRQQTELTKPKPETKGTRGGAIKRVLGLSRKKAVPASTNTNTNTSMGLRKKQKLN